MYNTNIYCGAWVVPQAKDCHEFNIITSTETSSRVAAAGADMAVREGTRRDGREINDKNLKQDIKSVGRCQQ